MLEERQRSFIAGLQARGLRVMRVAVVVGVRAGIFDGMRRTSDSGMITTRHRVAVRTAHFQRARVCDARSQCEHPYTQHQPRSAASGAVVHEAIHSELDLRQTMLGTSPSEALIRINPGTDEQSECIAAMVTTQVPCRLVTSGR